MMNAVEGPAAAEAILIRKQYRHPTRSMLWGAYLLGADATGTWLFSPAGTRYRAEQDGGVLYDDAPKQNTLHLSPRDAWYFARWDDERVLYIDAARPTEVLGREWRYEDLYLDLYKRGDGRMIIDDEDEFVAAITAGHLTSEEAAETRSAVEDALRAVEALAEPFDEMPWQRLDEAVALSLAPLTELPAVKRGRPNAG